MTKDMFKPWHTSTKDPVAIIFILFYIEKRYLYPWHDPTEDPVANIFRIEKFSPWLNPNEDPVVSIFINIIYIQKRDICTRV